MEAQSNGEPRIRLITTDDGSHSLFVPTLNETYHSFHGAVQESRHVFIDMSLKPKATESNKLKVFEVGFGTGLNALLTCEYASLHQLQVDYYSIEAFPVDAEMAQQLNYGSFVKAEGADEWFTNIHKSVWDQTCSITPYFSLHKIHKKLESYPISHNEYDIIYFDAFAPNKQAELWDLDILESMSRAMKPGGLFVTYCAKGQLKRDLASLGLSVETLPGPPGKKEMVRARKV